MRNTKRVHTGFVESNGTQLYYEMMGEGHPLVLLHGGYLDRRMWDDQFAAFAQDFQVIRYDICGFGKSALPHIPYADREDLAHLLTFLGIEKSYVLGFSLGGGIALDFTLEYPERVDALILVGSPVNPTGCATRLLLGAPRLLDHCRSPHARKVVVDRGFPASQRDLLLAVHAERRTAPIDLRLVFAFLDSRDEDFFLPLWW